MLIDTHCHLEMPKFDPDRPDVIERALEAGVKRMITVGTDIADNEKVLQVAHSNANVFCAVGIHPHEAKEATAENLQKLKEQARQPKVLALGEIGLDYYYDFSPRDVQQKAFADQVLMAIELGLPIVIHDRDAHEDVVGILKELGKAPYRGVFHCFSGDADFARQVLDLGFYLSFTGTVTFKKEVKSHEVLRMAPKDRVMVETDCPFLTPVPHRGHRNEPAYVKFVAEKVAEIWEMPYKVVEQMTTDNAYRLFGFETADKPSQVAYHFKDNLYLNITNRCSNFCIYCVKYPDYQLGQHNLRLLHEPTVEEIIEAAGDVSEYPEVVFCGLGESTERLDIVLEAAKKLREARAERIRLDTNGQGNLINQRPIAADLAKVIDAVSVSLNAQDAKTYQELCYSRFGDEAYEAVKQFIRDAKIHIGDVTASVVRHPKVDIDACREIAEEELGVKFRVRG